MVKIDIGDNKFFYADEEAYEKLKSWREEREKVLAQTVCKLLNWK